MTAPSPRLGARLVAAIIRCYPAAFRDRFGGEMLGAYLDQRDAVAARHGARAVARHTARTVAGLLRALVAVRLEERRRREEDAFVQRQSTTTERRALMEYLAADVRHALRTLRASPAFATLAVLTLALGIGANTAVFSVLNSVILAPLPYDEPERLVRIYTASRENPGDREYDSGLDLVDIRDRVDAFASVGMLYTYREVGADVLAPDGAPERVPVLPVNADYFRTLRATPLLGRTFARDEERPNVRRVILSHALWRRLTGGDSAIVGEGRTIAFNGDRYEVVGVMRPSFVDVVAGEDVAAWTPQNLQPGGANNRWNSYLSAVARLRPSVSVARAQAQVDALVARLAEQYPDSHRERRMRVVPLHEDVVGESRAPVYVLMGAAGLVLLIACVNVANLSLVRGVTRARETAVRTALGAARTRLVRERLAESLAVAAVGGAVGSAVAYWGVRLLLAVSPESLARAEAVRFDARLLGFALAVTVLTGLLFGVVPALRASRANPNDAMREGARGNTGGRASRRARGLLVASQLSLAVVLLVGAGLLLRSFVARQRVPLGFDAARVETFEVHLPVARYDSAERRVQFHAVLGERLRTLPGVARVGATSWLPANGDYHRWGFEYLDEAGRRASLAAQVRVIEGDLLEALSIPLRRGRRFTAADRRATPGVALVSQSLARRAYGARDPVGQRFSTGGREWQVVGVVGDVASVANGTRFETVYLSHAQFADDRNWALTYVVKAAGAGRAGDVVGPARRALAALDPALVLHRPRTMDAVLARHRARDRFTLLLMATFAGVALSLAAVGVYGVLSYAVTQRTHEIGVRMALGARPGQLRAEVIAEGLAVAGAGVAVGLGGALALGRVLQSLVYGVSTRDVTVFAGVALLLGAVVLAAASLPARRATRVHPLEALRGE